MSKHPLLNNPHVEKLIENMDADVLPVSLDKLIPNKEYNYPKVHLRLVQLGETELDFAEFAKLASKFGYSFTPDLYKIWRTE
ncbi:hypothetical protein V6R21_20220 [Limibacter armeniacum]|uniref:hypothetical protein n=1 Tax=Limibacter armeniacum TaxID=466084 RepID=UPI002FE5729E